MFSMLQGWGQNSSHSNCGHNVVYIDGSFVKHKIPVKPIYVTLLNPITVVSGKVTAWWVLGMMPSLRKSVTLEQTNTWSKERRLRLHHA
jgi:hypothetical protein